MTEGKDISVITNTLTAREMQEVIRKTLPPGVSQEQFTQAAVAALKRSPDIFMECERASIYNAVVEAARDGLLPDGRHGALVQFNTKDKNNWVKKCKFLIMPDGIIDKLAKLGITAYAVSVYEGEKIRIWNDDTGQHVEHEPNPFGSRGQRIGAYACGHVRSTGATYVEAMSMEDIEAVKRSSRSKDKNGNVVGAWVEWTDRMEQKSCLHRLEKRLPNVRTTDEYENEETPARAPVTINVPPAQPPSNGGGRSAALKKVVEDKEAPAPSDEEPPPLTEADAR